DVVGGGGGGDDALLDGEQAKARLEARQRGCGAVDAEEEAGLGREPLGAAVEHGGERTDARRLVGGRRAAAEERAGGAERGGARGSGPAAGRRSARAPAPRASSGTSSTK